MAADHRCGSCGATWSAGSFTPGCAECGGGALDRTCPLCGGACGRRWLRAVIDSQDTQIAHWIGACDRGATPAAAPGAVSEWWLDTSALPDHLWAELSALAGRWRVRDLDGRRHEFATRAAAETWLREEEYARLDDLKRDGDVDARLQPPPAGAASSPD